MEKYTPEMLMMVLGTIKNIVLIITCGVTTCTLYYLSKSWWSLTALLMLLALSSVRFIRD